MTNFRRLGQLLAATTVTATVLTGAPAAFAEDSVTFSVSNITDLHGHLANGLNTEKGAQEGDEMGVALLQSLIKKVNEGQNYALTTSGDNVGGSAYISAISGDKYTMDALNAMGVAASAAGNHEFDKGTEDLTGRITASSDFPILGANITKDGKPLLDASVVKEIDGVKVGFVGSITKNTENKVAPALIEGVEFGDPVEATNKEATRLKESGEADVVIALFHEDAQEYAEGFNKDVDVLFGGDTHLKTQGTVEREGALPLQWAQGWEYGKLLNDVDITFDRDADKITDITLTQYDATAAADLTEDEAIAQIVAEAQTKAKELGKEVIGTTEQAMFRGSDEGKDSGSNRGVESTLNNFIAQAQRASVAKATGKTIDLGVMNAGGVRADLDKGETTYEEVFTVQPFGNSVAYGKISGKDLIQAFENQWQPGNSRPRLSLGVSDNVSVVYDQTALQGKRVQSVTIDGKQVEAEKDYTIALSTFLIGGGDGFFAEGAIKDVTDLGYMDTQAMIDYIKAGDAKVRAGQSDVGVHIDGEVVPGKEITVNLSSLNYSTEGEPMAKTVTVELGGAKVTADIDNAAQAGDAQYGERGRASVKLTVPEDITGAQELMITTDAGTNVALPFDFGGDDKGDGSSDKGSSDNGSSKKDSSAHGSSIGGGIAALVAVIAAVAGALAMAGNALPEPVRSIIAQLRAQLKF